MRHTATLRRNWSGALVAFSLSAAAVAPALAAVRVWDGGSVTSGNWTDANNWNPNVAPAAGDQLVFPAGAARLTNTNNFTAGTGFDRIHFTGAGYQIHGNSLRLTNGIAAGNAAGNNVFRPNLVSTPGHPAFIVTNAGGVLTLAGSLDISAQRVTNAGAGTLILDGAVNGSAAGTMISKYGPGLLVFNGTNTYTGDHTNYAGGIRGAGAMGGGTWRLAPGASLDGHGTLNWLNSSGGILRPGVLGPGRLTFVQALVLDAATTVDIDLDGPAPGTQHDQIVVTNLATLGNAALRVSLNHRPLAGQSFVILDKRGPSLANGTFGNLPEGATWVTNGVRLAITYRGGESNDVILTVRNVEPTGVTRTWSGDAGPDTRWTTASNWDGGQAPQPGDDLVFPGLPGHRQLTNDFPAGTTFNSLRFTGADLTLAGNRVVLNAGLTNEPAATNTLALPLTLQSNQTFFAGPTGAVLICAAGLDTAGHVLTLEGDGDTRLEGTLAGYALDKFGAGALQLLAANTHTGLTTVAAGTLVVPHPGALGAASSSSGTIVSNAARLRVEGDFVLAEPVRLNGTLQVLGSNVFTGNWLNSGFTGVVEVAAGAHAVFSSQFSLAALVKTGGGEMELAGNAPSGVRISGVTRVAAGVLSLNKAPGAYAVSDVIVGDGLGGPDADVLRFLAWDQLFTNASVTVVESGWFDLDGWSHTLRGLSLKGGHVTTGPALLSLIVGFNSTAASNTARIEGRLNLLNTTFSQFTVEDGAPAEDLVVHASIGSAGNTLAKAGAGTLVLAGTNAYAPGTSILAGQLRVDGLLTNSPVTLAGGVLGGTGVVRSLAATTATGSRLSPGASPGRLRSGSVSLRPQVAFIAEWNGPVAGVEHDQLDVAGFVDLNGAALDLRLGFTPALGDSLTLVQNDGADAVTNTFAGLPQLGYFTNAAGALFRIDYAGGDGNDVVITRSATPPSTVTSLSCLTNGWKQILGQGLPGFPYILQAATNLAPPVAWRSIATNHADAAGLYSLLDTNWPSPPQRFYRVEPP